MNGYIEAGYTVVLGTLGVYAATLLRRERLARARLTPRRRQPAGTRSGAPDAAPPADVPESSPMPAEEASAP